MFYRGPGAPISQEITLDYTQVTSIMGAKPPYSGVLWVILVVFGPNGAQIRCEIELLMKIS